MHGSWRNWPGDSGGDSPGGTLSRARRANGAWAIGPVDAPRLWVELGSYPTVFWLLAASLVIAPRPCWRPARSRPARYEFVIERENRLRLEGKVATASGNRRAPDRALARTSRDRLCPAETGRWRGCPRLLDNGRSGTLRHEALGRRRDHSVLGRQCDRHYLGTGPSAPGSPPLPVGGCIRAIASPLGATELPTRGAKGGVASALTRTPVVGVSRGGRPRAGRPAAGASPRRQSAPSSACQWATPHHSSRAAPTWRAARWHWRST